jgi:hypothetical protein
MSRILASGLSFHDTEELLWEALETDGISPAVAETAAAFGGPPILAVPGIGGTAEASERAQRPMWRATYLLAMARRLQCPSTSPWPTPCQTRTGGRSGPRSAPRRHTSDST